MAKSQILQEIRDLFGNGDSLLVAAFGNRRRDSLAYQSTGIKSIYLIDSTGKVAAILDDSEFVSYTVTNMADLLKEAKSSTGRSLLPFLNDE